MSLRNFKKAVKACNGHLLTTRPFGTLLLCEYCELCAVFKYYSTTIITLHHQTTTTNKQQKKLQLNFTK